MGRPIRPNKTMPLPGLGVGILLESSKYGDRWCIIDRASAPLVLDGGPRWVLQRCSGGKSFYAQRQLELPDGKRTAQGMHALVAGTAKGQVTRHLNGDGLDNRRANLLPGTQRENQREQTRHRAGRLPGAHWHEGRRRWRAYTKILGKSTWIGDFATEAQASEAYFRFSRALAIQIR